MRMTGIVINGPIDSALINYVNLCTLKSVDNKSSFYMGPQKFLLVMRHGNITETLNAIGNSINVKVSLARMTTGVSCTSYTSDVI